MGERETQIERGQAWGGANNSTGGKKDGVMGDEGGGSLITLANQDSSEKFAKEWEEHSRRMENTTLPFGNVE